jgi:anthranilate synthase component 1
MRICFTQHTTRLDSDLETPVGFFIRLVGERQGILLESAEVDGRWGRYSIIAADFVLAASCREGLLHVAAADTGLAPLLDLSGKPFIQGLRELMAALHIEKSGEAGQEQPPITRALYGYLGYGLAGLLEPKLAAALPPQEAEACLVLPGTLIVFDHGYNRITRISLRLDGREIPPLPPVALAVPPEADAAAFAAPASPPPLAGEAGYTTAVARIKEQIRQGEAIQVVLSTPFSAPLAESPFNLYRRLRRVNPSPYMFYMRLPGPVNGVLLGSSPEVLVTCEADKLRLCPIAGTRPRSRDLAEDALFGDELLQDPKEKAEHVMLVDLGRNDLGRIAASGSVKLERFMEVERFSHVMHLTSRISALLAPGLDALDVLAAAFPAGTVSGAPKVRAMELVAQEERCPRGPYAGAIGWLGLDADGVNLDLGITIRSLWVRGGQVRWQAGAGIVHDSVPEMEWKECCAKARVIRDVVLGEEAAD